MHFYNKVLTILFINHSAKGLEFMWWCHNEASRPSAGEKKRSLGRDYHPLCLKCQECKRQLNPGQHAEVQRGTAPSRTPSSHWVLLSSRTISPFTPLTPAFVVTLHVGDQKLRCRCGLILKYFLKIQKLIWSISGWRLMSTSTAHTVTHLSPSKATGVTPGRTDLHHKSWHSPAIFCPSSTTRNRTAPTATWSSLGPEVSLVGGGGDHTQHR